VLPSLCVIQTARACQLLVNPRCQIVTPFDLRTHNSGRMQWRVSSGKALQARHGRKAIHALLDRHSGGAPLLP